VIGSAAALRGMKRTSTYSAARGAQLAWVRAAGVETRAREHPTERDRAELCRNPTYFPARCRQTLRSRSGSSARCRSGAWYREMKTPLFAAYSPATRPHVSSARYFPVCGGWVA